MDKGTLQKYGAANVNRTGVVAAVTLTGEEDIISGTANTANPSFTITLPPVSEMAGRTIAIEAFLIADGQAITVQDQDESIGWTPQGLDETDDVIVLLSTGRQWLIMYTNLS